MKTFDFECMTYFLWIHAQILSSVFYCIFLVFWLPYGSFYLILRFPIFIFVPILCCVCFFLCVCRCVEFIVKIVAFNLCNKIYWIESIYDLHKFHICLLQGRKLDDISGLHSQQCMQSFSKIRVLMPCQRQAINLNEKFQRHYHVYHLIYSDFRILPHCFHLSIFLIKV